jgi:hypothetical protein
METGARIPAGTRVEQITLTVDADAVPATAELVHRLRGLGFAVTQQTFVQTEVEERRPALLLTLHRPLVEAVELVTAWIHEAPAGVWPSLVSTLAALGSHRVPAVLQVKALDAFVSLVAQDLPDVEQAARLLTAVAASAGGGALGEPWGVTERRLVYSGGSWTIRGQWQDETLVYDAETGRLRPAPAL